MRKPRLTKRETRARYLKYRANGVPARTAIAWARTVNPSLDWRSSLGGRDTATFKHQGFDVVAEVSPDEYTDLGMSGLGTFEREYEPGDIVRYGPDDGYRRNRELRYFRPVESVAAWRKEFQRSGMAKGPAEEAARALRFDAARRAVEYQAFNLLVTVSRHGVELGSASLGGIDLGGTSTENEDYLTSTVFDILPEAIDDARASLEKLCRSKRKARA